jgi:predicted negative regulator of RcsB-dependent stress response
VARESGKKKWSHREVQELIHEEELLVTYLKRAQDWWNKNGKVVSITVAVLALVAAVAYLWYTTSAGKEREALALLQSARTEYEKGDALDAVTSSCQEILSNSARTAAAPQAMVLLADAYLDGRQLDKAEQAYQNYLGAYPNGSLVPQVKRNLALLAAERGDNAKAIAELEGLLAAGIPGIASDELRYLIARQYEQGGQEAKALELYEAIGEGSAWRAEAQNRLDWLKAKPAEPLLAPS